MTARRARRPRLAALLAAASVIASGLVARGASADVTTSPHPPCGARTLVMSAMPVELGPLLARETHVSRVTIAGRDYYIGTLAGHPVVLALTGIGPVNARTHTQQAFSDFSCHGRSGITSVVFSGVAGGDYIGDVTVPTAWTLDAGRHLLPVDARMLAVARRVARSRLPLETKAPAGDPACGCLTSPDAVTTVSVTHTPRVNVGGAGQTTDPFTGRALPCVPNGGDVFGCEPCPAIGKEMGDAQRFAPGALPFVNPAFFTGYFAATASQSSRYVAQDEETAAVDAVARAHDAPFIGFRAISDGGGDPIGLPGFPFQFFYYRQLAADNAAITTLAFLSAWRGR